VRAHAEEVVQRASDELVTRGDRKRREPRGKLGARLGTAQAEQDDREDDEQRRLDELESRDERERARTLVRVHARTIPDARGRVRKRHLTGDLTGTQAGRTDWVPVNRARLACGGRGRTTPQTR